MRTAVFEDDDIMISYTFTKIVLNGADSSSHQGDIYKHSCNDFGDELAKNLSLSLKFK